MRRAEVGARLAITLSVVLGALVVLVVLGVGVLIATRGGHLSIRLPVRHTESFDAAGIDLPPLDVHRSELRTPDGATVQLRGVMVPDPAVLAADGRFEHQLTRDIAATGATVVRVPVHPGRWNDDGDYLWRYLDPIVRWAGEEHLYVIIDWHVIGDVTTATSPTDPELYVPDLDTTREFWTAVATHFADTPHVLFEIVNEPAGISADDWRDVADELTDLIREQGATQPVVVGGTEWARDLSWLADGGVDDPDVVYATHIYPGHARAWWESWFGGVADRYPLLLTEWGFQDGEAAADGPAYLAGNAAGYARPLLDALEQEGAAGWVACWWDDEWDPQMFHPADDGDELGDPTTWGAFVLAELARD